MNLYFSIDKKYTLYLTILMVHTAAILILFKTATSGGSFPCISSVTIIWYHLRLPISLPTYKLTVVKRKRCIKLIKITCTLVCIYCLENYEWLKEESCHLYVSFGKSCVGFYVERSIGRRKGSQTIITDEFKAKISLMWQFEINSRERRCVLIAFFGKGNIF